MSLRLRAFGRVFMGVCLAPVFYLVVGMFFVRIPVEASAKHGSSASSLRVYDREHRLLREVRSEHGALRTHLPLTALGDRVREAVIAAEDVRFRKHVGIDPIAIVRALISSLRAHRVVSGASTLSMQLARTLKPHPKTLRGKLEEASLALKLELFWGKDRILEEYLNRVSFGPQLEGVEAAAQFYFNKPASAVSFAEAATLASMPKNPSRYPKTLERLKTRRDYVLGRMVQSSLLGEDALTDARSESLTLGHFTAPSGAQHFVDALRSGALSSGSAVTERSELSVTLDTKIQAIAEFSAAHVVSEFEAKHVTAASVVVLDNASGDVLAYVGAPPSRAGHVYVDGVLALRQPGSALKPFVYALAMEKLGMQPWTLLPDLPLRIEAAGHDDSRAGGPYVPQNYDGRFHGPVRLREALANSYNIPAVYLADKLGPQAVLTQLRALGMHSLTKSAEDYGAAIALGDGEVRLLDLARAYSTLARGGLDKAPRWLLTAPVSEAVRVIPEDVAHLTTHMLSDNAARLSAFGAGNALEFGFDVAAKTGTSKGYRDNWTVGYTSRYTVGVWVGNFNGSPMQGVSGVTGAGALFHEVVTALSQGELTGPLLRSFEEKSSRSHRVCTLSGGKAGPHCAHAVAEFGVGNAVPEMCTMHVQERIDAATGLLAGSSCPGATLQAFESFGEPYAAWALSAGRNLAPNTYAPSCPGDPLGAHARAKAPPQLLAPTTGTRFLLDTTRTRASQSVDVRGSVTTFTLYVDGVRTGTTRTGQFNWLPHEGAHELWIDAGEGSMSPHIHIEVAAL
jgi:penicillin-binding protein 1C